MATVPNSTGAQASPLAPNSSNVIAFRPAACPEHIDPRVWRKALRQRVEVYLGIVQGLLALLDDMEADCDLEDGGDYEPSLGAPDVFTVDGFQTDLEADDLDRGEADYVGNFGASGFADEEPNTDDEYSAGVDVPEATFTEWSEAHPVQTVPGIGL